MRYPPPFALLVLWTRTAATRPARFPARWPRLCFRGGLAQARRSGLAETRCAARDVRLRIGDAIALHVRLDSRLENPFERFYTVVEAMSGGQARW